MHVIGGSMRMRQGLGGFWECGRGGELKAMPHFILLMLREENSSRRESESMALLEKLIRLDSKDCNFHFKDERKAYTYPLIARRSLFPSPSKAASTSRWPTRKQTPTTTPTKDSSDSSGTTSGHTTLKGFNRNKCAGCTTSAHSSFLTTHLFIRSLRPYPPHWQHWCPNSRHYYNRHSSHSSFKPFPSTLRQPFGLKVSISH